MGERMWGDERILGDSDFVRHVLLEAGDKLTQKERHKQSGWSLDLLLETISEIFRIDSSSIQEKKRDTTTSKARSLFCWWATNNLGFTLAAVAEFLQLSRSAVFQARKNGEQVAREEKVIFPSE
jgi:chromosomal replication initiation ATPase DnaA